MLISKEKLFEIISDSIKSILVEEKSVFIDRKNWKSLDYYNGERVLECTPKSIIACSDNLQIRIFATKRYERPDEYNPANGYFNKYWKFFGWQLNALAYRNGTWEIFDNTFPRMFKSKSGVLEFIRRTKSFSLAKKELNL